MSEGIPTDHWPHPLTRLDRFPYKIGYDAAGTVTAVGADVKAFKVGDEIYVRLPETHRGRSNSTTSGSMYVDANTGSWAEYAVCPEQFLALKPKSAGLSEAASLPLTGMTALQAFRKYNGSLEGKTVFIPAGRTYQLRHLHAAR
jgi:NADPH:quinone reductase-like Zn-dependent oxidoreductase